MASLTFVVTNNQPDQFFILNGDGDTIDYRQVTTGIEADFNAELVTRGGLIDSFSDMSLYELTFRGTNKGDDIAGNAEDNKIFGNGGADTLIGRGGDDTLNGGGGNDVINGGNGDDKIIGAGGSDTLTGGNGEDSFIINNAHIQSGKTDVITDYTLAEDTVTVSGSKAVIDSIDEVFGGTEVTYANGYVLYFEGVQENVVAAGIALGDLSLGSTSSSDGGSGGGSTGEF